MKLKVGKKEFDSIGGKSAEFSVDTEDTMIIRLLRDKMYKNKIGAVSREIASNSRDANREAGKKDTPVIIEIGRGEGDILSDSETYISFRDSGIGITPDRMEHIFLKYGGSTKRDSDKFTGGFGIGAKTPFAYTDNFFITTIAEVDGKRMKYYYQAAITSDGKREVSQMVSLGEEETNEPTGTEITVPINQNDSTHFMKEVLYATSFWRVQPILKGFDRSFALETVHDGKSNYKIIKDVNKLYGDNTQYIALIDGIPYVLDMNQLKNAQGMFNTETDRYGRQTNGATGFITVFEFQTGEITVSGSREDIEYVEENIKAFTTSNNKMKDEVKGLIEKYLGEATNYYERCVKANSISSANYRYGNTANADKGDYVVFLGKLASSVGIKDEVIYGTYKGDKVVDKHSFTMHEMDIFTISGGKMKKSSSLSYENYGGEKWKLPVYYLDLAKSEPARNAMLKQLHIETGYVLIKEKKVEQGMGARTTQEENRIVEEKGFFKLIGLNEKWKKYTEVEKLKKESGATRNITDIVKVSLRYLRNPNSWNMEWTAFTPDYDKKEEEFVGLLESCNALGQGVVTKIAYFEVEKLTDLNGNGYSSPNGMDKDQTMIHSLLKLDGVLTLAVSKSKVQYFEKANIKSMEETFVEVMKAKAKNDVLIKAIDFAYASSNKAHEIYFDLNFGKDLDKKIEPLKSLLKFANDNKAQMERYSKVVGGIGADFAEKYKVGVSEEITNAVATLNQIKKDNALITVIVDMESMGSFKGTPKLNNAIAQLKKLFKNQKE